MRCNTSFPPQYSMSLDVTTESQRIFLYPGRYVDTIQTNQYTRYSSPNPTTCEENGEVTMNAITSTYSVENVINTRLVTNSDLGERFSYEENYKKYPLYRYVDDNSVIPYESVNYPKGLQVISAAGHVNTVIAYWNDAYAKNVNIRFYSFSDNSKMCTVRLNAVI